MNFEQLLRLPLHEARLTAEKQGFKVRVTRRDGETLMVTQDVDQSRVNVWTEDGKVVQIAGLG